MSEVKETKQVYVAYTNTDCTEGRGYDVPIAVCEMEETAKRMAKGKYLQGSDGPVRSATCIKLDQLWYAPMSIVRVIAPSDDDRKKQKAEAARKQVIEKMKAAGLTEDEIHLLQYGAAKE